MTPHALRREVHLFNKTDAVLPQVPSKAKAALHREAAPGRGIPEGSASGSLPGYAIPGPAMDAA